MRSRSSPTARRTALIGSRLPDPELSDATAVASCNASGADKLVIPVPNRMRDSSSSCGNCGTLVKAISGLQPGALHRDRGIDPLHLRLGANVELRIDRAFAAEADRPAVEPERAPGKFIIAAHEVGLPREARRVGAPADVERGRPAAVDAEPAHRRVRRPPP